MKVQFNKKVIFFTILFILLIIIFIFIDFYNKNKVIVVTEYPQIENKNYNLNSNDVNGVTSGIYIDYSEDKFLANSNKKRVIFFHANWCPYCIDANRDILSRLREIPVDVVLFKADYDKEKDLKKRYGVTYQHTFVQVDSNGEIITKWNGGGIDELKNNIK